MAAMDKEDVSGVLEICLSGISDVLGVPLIAVGPKNSPLTEWIIPKYCLTRPSSFRVIPVTSFSVLPFSEVGLYDEIHSQRFLVPFCFEKEKYYIQSDDLPKEFPWIHSELISPLLPDCDSEFTGAAYRLLEIYLSKSCEALLLRTRNNGDFQVNAIDIENVRRIGISLRENIKWQFTDYDPGPFSLDGFPALESFLCNEEKEKLSNEILGITEILRKLSVGSTASFNLMSLSGRFVIRATSFSSICKNRIRKKTPFLCFRSDIESLLYSALNIESRKKIHRANQSKCHAGFLEIHCPIFVNGLIVGLAFGGQLVESNQDLKTIEKYLEESLEEKIVLEKVRVSSNEDIEKSESIVEGIASLTATLHESWCIAYLATRLSSGLLELATCKRKTILSEACILVKKMLTASECTIFTTEKNKLVLAETTSESLLVREKPKGEPRWVDSVEVMGKPMYDLGEGITGGVALDLKSRYLCHVKRNPYWAGKCGELDLDNQCLIAPIFFKTGWGTGFYGVIRAARPGVFEELPAEFVTIFSDFARELGIILKIEELTSSETRKFLERAERLKSQLAAAAHEYKSPLHNMLQIVDAVILTDDMAGHRFLYEMLRYQVMRAKRITHNYLVAGVEGQEEIEYDIEENDLIEIVDNCIEWHTYAASEKGAEIILKREGSGKYIVNCDKMQIEQVITNLLDNAIKYGYYNRNIRVIVRSHEETIAIMLISEGQGIPKSAYKRIFEGYQRFAEDSRFFKPGTGLGCKISKKIIEDHGGSIQVNSEPYINDPRRIAMYDGFRTTFVVVLPK